MHRRLFVHMLVLTGLIAVPRTALSQENLSEAEKAKRRAAFYETMRPGPEHDRLQALAGKWDQEIKYWTEPGKPPMIMKARCENRMILGNRFLVVESKAEGA